MSTDRRLILLTVKENVSLTALDAATGEMVATSAPFSSKISSARIELPSSLHRPV